MRNLLKVNVLFFLFMAGTLFSSCKFSYSFTGSSVDYTRVSSISIKDFPNLAPLVYAPLSQQFTELLRDKYTRQTKLQVIREGGDYDLEGEITGYNLTSMAVTDGAFASQTRLTVTVRVRFVNSTNPEEDFEKNYSAYQEFSNQMLIDDVQDDLCDIIMKEIIDQIFNDTVANW